MIIHIMSDADTWAALAQSYAQYPMVVNHTTCPARLWWVEDKNFSYMEQWRVGLPDVYSVYRMI